MNNQDRAAMESALLSDAETFGVGSSHELMLGHSFGFKAGWKSARLSAPAEPCGECERLRELMRCADTPLMRDVMSERDQLRADLARVTAELAEIRARPDPLAILADAAGDEAGYGIEMAGYPGDPWAAWMVFDADRQYRTTGPDPLTAALRCAEEAKREAD